MKATLKVAYPGEPERRFKITERAVIGSGSESTVRLTDAGLLDQHFSVKPMDDGVKVRLAHGAPTMAHEGAEFVGGVIPYDSDFYVGQQRFTVVRSEGIGGSGGPSPIVLAAVAVGIAFAALSFFAPEPIGASSASTINIPNLFGDVPCGAAQGRQAYRAKEAERGARAKQERYIFDPHDGIVAGRLLAEAASCYALAKDDASAKRVSELGRSWREKVTTDIAAARLRLELALDAGDMSSALDNVRNLLELLHDERVPVVDELVRLGRRIEHQMKGKK